MKRIVSIFFLLICYPLSAQVYITELGDFGNANSFCINPAGAIYVVDSENSEISKLDTLGNILFTTGGYGWSEAAFDEPVDIFATTLKVYVVDKNNNRIQEFDKNLNYRSQLKGDDERYSNYPFAYPKGGAFSNHGDFFILDSDNLRILKYNLASGFLLEIGDIDAGEYTLNSPKTISISPDGKLFVLDENHITVFDQFGTGLVKLTPSFTPTNLNITFNWLVINNANKIAFIDLTKTQGGFKKFTPKDGAITEEIIETSLYNNKMYILTPKKILVYTTK